MTKAEALALLKRYTATYENSGTRVTKDLQREAQKVIVALSGEKPTTDELLVLW